MILQDFARLKSADNSRAMRNCRNHFLLALSMARQSVEFEFTLWALFVYVPGTESATDTPDEVKIN